MKKKMLIIGLAALVCASLGFGDAANALQRVDGKMVMVIGGRQPAPDIDPSHKTDYSRRMIQQAFYDGLFKYVGNPAKVEPWLATGYEASPDARIWTIKMVKNAKFHNGDPVTAEAVKWSIERTLKLNKGPSWMLSDVLDPKNITVVDDYTIKFELKTPYAPFISVLPWFYVMNPKQVMAHAKDGDYGQAWLKENEAGSGPFTKGRWQHGVLYEMKAVADYWKGWPSPKHPDSVIFKLIRETNSLKIGLQKGQLDIALALSADDFDLLKSYKGVKVTSDPGVTTLGLKMNTQKGYTKDINIRKAICYAVDYESMLKTVNGKAVLEDSPFPIGLKGHVATKAYRQDLAKAKEYMKKAGYPDGGFELEYVYVQGLDSEKNIGLLLIDNLAKIGIKVKMVPLTWPSMTARGSKVETSPALMAIFATPKFNDPDAVAYQYYKKSWGRYYGSSFYENKEVWKLIEEARSISDWGKRAPMYKKIQEMIMADAPEVFCMQLDRQFALRDYVKGFTFCPVRFTAEVDIYPLYVGK
ncbi:ABC transporter substrate-binding protein [Dethiosulfatarculus sandiegensis]|uniref:Peptide ABC transporter substrate-binding protein n=1 Tax=Dethiosulfatarculus sandiegensis TaxID=1429043 RepID=A0A0D2JXH4_9BACT|nr:ABC transporter substrate-binding protein [Dethiosulfatarculus sandiegensis]KIX14290.1 peptide ABC transporter substrate-binding protein [Dethiosulfatarculus sandiegensis]